MAEKDFAAIAKARYEELLRHREAVDRELKPLQTFLMNAGILKKAPGKRGRKPKAQKA